MHYFENFIWEFEAIYLKSFLLCSVEIFGVGKPMSFSIYRKVAIRSIWQQTTQLERDF